MTAELSCEVFALLLFYGIYGCESWILWGVCVIRLGLFYVQMLSLYIFLACFFISTMSIYDINEFLLVLDYLMRYVS